MVRNIHNYFQTTSHLCIYHMKTEYIPYIFFPKVLTVSIINCSKTSIPQLLRPQIFPNLSQIHYLSLHPGTYTIHKHFENVKWVFPNNKHEFYHCMTIAGMGRIDKNLIATYVAGHIKDDIQLRIPGYNTVPGSWYKEQLYTYFLKKNKDPYALYSSVVTTPENKLESSHDFYPFQNYYKKSLQKKYFNDMLEEHKDSD